MDYFMGERDGRLVFPDFSAAGKKPAVFHIVKKRK